MAVIKKRPEAVDRLYRVFGLDPRDTPKLVVVVEWNHVVTYYVKGVVTLDQMEQFVGALEAIPVAGVTVTDEAEVIVTPLAVEER